MRKNKNKTKERILKVAMELVYEKGFINTSVQDILDKCKLTKPAFYYYFPSKDALGLEYLTKQEELNREYLLVLMNSSKTPEEFAAKWVSVIKKWIKVKKYNGCPFVNFLNQLEIGNTKFNAKFKEIELSWTSLYKNYLRIQAEKGLIDKNTNLDKAARKMALIYEGSINLWKMSKDVKYLDFMGEELKELMISLEVKK
ncbi:MAG: TetR/AcrR family transcriptional regulator [Leptospiraceae bacterium]|nr:TetR/AcrR family transcriptional regulator [Leptospiraceae bacterium]